jgi:hypothetical protein
MDRLGEGQLREIETRLSRRIVTEFGLDPTGLAPAGHDQTSPPSSTPKRS